MDRQHFALLKASGHPTQFSGPLARVLSSRLENNKLLRTLVTLASLGGHREVELLGMDTEVTEDGLFSCKASGPLAILPSMARAVNSVQKAVRNRGKPIIIRNNHLIYTSYQPPVPSKASMKLLGSRLSQELTGHPQPTVCTLQITTRCQANCIHCSAARHKRPDEELSTDDWKRVIREAEAAGVVSVVFTGGEPLLRPDVFDLIRWVDKDEAVVLMFCNGLLLNEDNVRKLADAGLWCIHVSIDSPDPVAHDQMRRVPGCFDKAIEGLQRCKDAGILTGISTYATPERLHNGQVVEMIELAKKMGVDEITIFDVVPTGRLLTQDRKYLLTEEDKAELCRLEELYNEGHSLPHVITQAHVNGPKGVGCYAGWCQFYVTAFGEMTPCDFTPLSFGNVREGSVEDIWSRMISHPAYCSHMNHCRMQDQEFRKRYIDRIPLSGPFPYPACELDNLEDAMPYDEMAEAEYSSLGIKG